MIEQDVIKGGKFLLHGQRTFDINKYKFGDPLVSSITGEDIERIESLYKIDYDNGWY